MAESSSQDRTEAPTPRKLSKAREDGQVARSVELPAAAVVIGAFLFLMLSGSWVFTKVGEQMIAAFRFDPKLLAQPALLPAELGRQVVDGLLIIAPLVAFCAVIAVLASGLTGGYLFSLKSVQPRASKISPIEGFKRMFGAHAAVELAKALLKFVLVAGILWAVILVEIDKLLALGGMALELSIVPGKEGLLDELASRIEEITKPGAPRYPVPSYKYAGPRTAASLHRLAHELRENWGSGEPEPH
jgi:flagellar biosynthetic protein FlhB